MISAVSSVQPNCKQNMASNVNFEGKYMYAGTYTGKIKSDAIELVAKVAGQDGVEALGKFKAQHNVMKDIGYKLGSWWKNFVAQFKDPRHSAIETTQVGVRKGKLFVRHGLNISGMEVKGSKTNVLLPEHSTGEQVMEALENARELSRMKTNLEYAKKRVNDPGLIIEGYPPKA